MSTETEVENKAKMLINLFFQGSHMVAKRFALIAVDEIIAANPVEWTKKENQIDEDGEPATVYTCSSTRTFWNKVSEKIKTL